METNGNLHALIGNRVHHSGVFHGFAHGKEPPGYRNQNHGKGDKGRPDTNPPEPGYFHPLAKPKILRPQWCQGLLYTCTSRCFGRRWLVVGSGRFRLLNSPFGFALAGQRARFGTRLKWGARREGAGERLLRSFLIRDFCPISIIWKRRQNQGFCFGLLVVRG